MAFAVFIGVTIVGIVKHGTKWFSYFFPPGAPISHGAAAGAD